MKKSFTRKSLSVLLSLLMLLSVFSGMAFTASATDYSGFDYVEAAALQPGDSIAYQVILYDSDRIYSFVLKGGTYCEGDPNENFIFEIYSDDLTIDPENFNLSYDYESNKPCVRDDDSGYEYYFLDAVGNMSDTVYVLDADHTNHVITLGGHDPADRPTVTFTDTLLAYGTVEMQDECFYVDSLTVAEANTAYAFHKNYSNELEFCIVPGDGFDPAAVTFTVGETVIPVTERQSTSDAEHAYYGIITGDYTSYCYTLLTSAITADLVVSYASHTHNDVTFAPWEDTTSLPASGSYYLTADVTLDEYVMIEETLDLCLNGHTVTLAGDDTVIVPAYGGTLNLYDDTGDGSIIGGTGLEGDGGAIFAADGVFNMYGGTITGGSVEDDGGAVYLMKDSTGSTFNMYGGTITGNAAVLYGGAVFLAEGRNTFHMYGGVISDNTATAGGGVCLNRSSTFIMEDGACITGNVANCVGGGVSNYAGTFIMNGGSIDHNKATYNEETNDEGNNGHGGGVYNDADMELNGGVITGNTAHQGGGIFSLIQDPDCALRVSGGSVTGNTADFAANILTVEDVPIVIADALPNDSVFGVTLVDADVKPTEGVFTSGLSGKGSLNNFINENGDGFEMSLDDDGEAQFVAAAPTQTVTLSFSEENADVYWEDADGAWSIDAAATDYQVELVGFYESEAAGTYTWEQMDGDMSFIYVASTGGTTFTDGSCTVVIEEGFATVSGVFTGNDGKTYNITITAPVPAVITCPYCGSTWNEPIDDRMYLCYGCGEEFTPSFPYTVTFTDTLLAHGTVQIEDECFYVDETTDAEANTAYEFHQDFEGQLVFYIEPGDGFDPSAVTFTVGETVIPVAEFTDWDATDDAHAYYDIVDDDWTSYTIYTSAITGDLVVSYDAPATNPDQEAADPVITLINAIGTVTLGSEDAISVARHAYNQLSDAQKELVTNYSILTTAEATLADLHAADDVIDMIGDIGTVEYTAECKEKIDEAREAYDALTVAQKNLVTNYTDLTDAETTYAALEAAALAQAKTDAKDELAGYKGADAYRVAQQMELADAIAAGNNAIDAATTIADVATALANAKAAIDAIKTDAELTAEEAAAALAQAKTDAKNELAAYKNAADYRAAEQTALADAITAGNTAIDDATTTTDVATALANAKAAIDAIKTDAQLTAEEAAAEDLAAFNAYVGELVNALISAYDSEKDSEAVYNILNDAHDAIQDAQYDETKTLDENKAAVLDIYNNAIADANAQRDAEAAEKALADAKEQLTGAVNTAKAFYDTIKDTQKYATIADTLDTAIQQGEAMLNSDSAADILAKAEQVLGVLASVKEQKDTIDATPTDEPTPEKPTTEPTGEEEVKVGNPALYKIIKAIVDFIVKLFTKFIPSVKNLAK